MPLIAPDTIVSDRLYIRRVAESDLSALFVVNGNDDVTRFLPYATWVTPSDSIAWLNRMRGQEAAGTALQLVLIERASEIPVGSIVLHRYDEASARVELGYVLGRPWWGRGYMREALQSLVATAFGSMRVRRLEAEVDPTNVASVRLLETLGFRHEGTLRQRWTGKGRTYDVRLYGALASEWECP